MAFRILVVLAVAAAFYLMVGAGAGTAGPLSAVPGGADAGHRSPSGSGGAGSPLRATVRDARLLVRGEAGAVIVGAELYNSAPDGAIVPGAQDAIATSDERGRMLLPRGLVLPALVVAEGYMPGVLTEAGVHDGQLVLDRGDRFTVRVSDAIGNPLADAEVVLRSVASGDYRMGYEGTHVGHPLHADPYWSARSSGRGEVVFAGLPRKPMRLQVRAAGRFPLTRMGAFRKVLPPGEAGVSLDEIWGVCAIAPAGMDVTNWEWTPVGELSRSIEVLSSLEFNRACLEQRFPGALCAVAVPADAARDCVMSCRVTMRDGSYWTAEWPLRRWSQIEPVYLQHSVSVQARRIEFAVEDLDGRRLDPQLSVFNRGDKTFVPIEEGACSLIPGEYRVVPRAVSPWLSRSLRGADFTVGATLPANDRVVVRADARLCKVTLKFASPTKELIGVLRAKFWDSDGGNATLLNLDSLGSVSMYGPPGAFTVRVRGAAYEEFKKTIELSRDTDVSVSLQPKNR